MIEINNQFSDIKKAIGMYPPNLRRNLVLRSTQLFFLNFMDLVAIAFIAAMAAIGVHGINGSSPGKAVNSIINLLGISNLTLTWQMLILSATSIVFLGLKSVISFKILSKLYLDLGKYSAELSENLVSRFLLAPSIQLLNFNSSQIFYAITSGVNAIGIGIIGSFIAVIADFSLLTILVLAILVVDPVVAVLSLLIFIVIIFVLNRLLNKSSKNYGEISSELTIDSNRVILEAISTQKELFLRGQSKFYVDKIKLIRLSLSKVLAAQAMLPNKSKYVLEIAVSISIFLISIIQFALLDPVRAIASLSIFLAASSRLAPAALRLIQNYLNVASSIGVGKNTFLISEQLNPLKGAEEKGPNGSPEIDFYPEIVISDLNFSHHGSADSQIHNINTVIEADKFTALVGTSGSGKTTLLNIILGFYTPSQGKVSISGESPSLAIKTWPGLIAYVPQDVYLIEGTIRENISLGFTELVNADEDLWMALKLAGLEEILTKNSLGLDSLISENGGNFSGGQRQKFGIARALLTKPRFLILDESTSSLDGESEKEIYRTLFKLRGTMTVLVVAHRLTAIQDFDKIIYLEDGRILLEGTFDFLKNNLPEFRNQLGFFDM